jgi:hypothetical protein
VDDLRDLSRQREQEQDREHMRDTSHDHRLKIGPNTSVTIDQQEGAPMIDLKHTTLYARSISGPPPYGPAWIVNANALILLNSPKPL